jgi:hypothetical protein
MNSLPPLAGHRYLHVWFSQLKFLYMVYLTINTCLFDHALANAAGKRPAAVPA